MDMTLDALVLIKTGSETIHYRKSYRNSHSALPHSSEQSRKAVQANSA